MSKLITTTCKQCGKEITHYQSKAKPFCSRHCMGLWRSEHWHGFASPAWKDGRLALPCKVCGKPIRISPSQIESKKTCSKVCDADWRRQTGMYSGSNNPAYKGGIATYMHSHGKAYKILRGKRKKVYEHRAIMEEKLGRPLERWEEVHHINGNTLDNRYDNLYVVDKKNHSRVHFDLFKRIQRLEQENKRLKAKVISVSSQTLL